MGRAPWRLIEVADEGEAVKLFSSPALVDELAHTLAYAKFTARHQRFGTSIAALMAQYTALVTVVTPTSVPRAVRNDADDDHVIAAAVAARAQFIVTGDRKHLLPVGRHQEIAIVTAREVLARIEAQRASRSG